jgi:replicative DNA helicase
MTHLSGLTKYGRGFQFKVIRALFTDRPFISNVRDLLDESHFDTDAYKWLIVNIVSYYDEYNTTISMDALSIELEKVENDVFKVAIKQEIRNCYEASTEDIDYVKSEFTSFCKNQKLKNALLDSVDLLESGNFDGIRTAIEKALKAGADKNLGHNFNKDIETRYREDYRPVIETPWPVVNEVIQGGWGPGDLILMFGSPGSGKSWIMVEAAAHAVRAGYTVNYYTLELGEDYVGKRFDCYFTGCSIENISSKRGEVEKVVKGLKGKLIIKEYAPKSASIGTIKSHISRCQDEDHNPNLIIIDYLDYLRATRHSSYSEKKDEIDDVYIAAKTLAKELKIPILSPSQVNRTGAKDDIIEGDKAAGSYDKIMVADLCFSLSRKKEDKLLGTGRVHIMKNRYGKDGMTYDVKVDTETGHTVFNDEVEMIGDTNSIKTEGYKDIARNFFNNKL